jgi:hypothetical protein
LLLAAAPQRPFYKKGSAFLNRATAAISNSINSIRWVLVSQWLDITPQNPHSISRSSYSPPRDPPFFASPRMLKTAVLAGLVAGAAAVVPSTWCNSAPPSGWDVCNPSLSLDVRSADIVSRLSIADKIKALGTGTPALSSINLPQYKQVREPNPSIVTHEASSNHTGLAVSVSLALRPPSQLVVGGDARDLAHGRQPAHAVGVQHDPADHGELRVQPLPLARDGQPDRPRGARVPERRSRGLDLLGAGHQHRARPAVRSAHAPPRRLPVHQLTRAPLRFSYPLLGSWGRNIESAGEDPFVSGQYAANWVQGFEHAKETPYPLQASACCKHFVANELDGWNGTDRNHIDVFVPQQDLADSYLPSFQTCVEQGKVSGIMCSCEFRGSSADALPGVLPL